jgi:hypothetical protein
VETLSIPPPRTKLNGFLQHLAEPRNAYADVFLVRAAEAMRISLSGLG